LTCSGLDPESCTIRYTYDKVGRVTSKTDEDSHETLYTYNLANQITKVAYADGKTVQLTYNALKQLTEMRDWLGTTTIEVNPLGQATKVTDHNGNEICYSYNNLGLRESLTYPDGKVVQYEYTPSGKLSTVIASPSSVIASPSSVIASEREAIHTTSYTYDKLGRVSERILPDSTTTKYEYNQLGTLSSLIHSKDNNILDQFHYTHDPVGNIVQIEKYRSRIETDNGVFKYVYDPLNRLTQAIRGDGSSKQYEYDALGNRIASIQNGIETRHSFNARNQLVQTADGSDITDYLYDKRGNLTQTTINGQLQHRYIFDATNMMTAAYNPAKGDATYTYNGFRNRVAKLANMANTNYVLDMTRPYDNLLATQGVQTQTFIWGNNLLSAEGENIGQTFYYLQDHLGSPIRLLGENNHDTAMSYDEFGVPEVTAGVSQPFGYTSYQTDSVSGLYYAQARYYTPQIGRFTSEDLIKGFTSLPQSLNPYAYCWNQPVNYVDLDGMLRMPQWMRDAGNWVSDQASNAWDSVSNAASAAGQWAKDNSTTLITAAIVVACAVAIVATAGAATPLAAAAIGTTVKAMCTAAAVSFGVGFGVGAGINIVSQYAGANGPHGWNRVQQIDFVEVGISGATIGTSAAMTAFGVPAPIAYGVVAGAGRDAIMQARQVDAGSADSINLNQVAISGLLTGGFTKAGELAFNWLAPKVGGRIGDLFGSLSNSVGQRYPSLAGIIGSKATGSNALKSIQGLARGAGGWIRSQLFNNEEECGG